MSRRRKNKRKARHKRKRADKARASVTRPDESTDDSWWSWIHQNHEPLSVFACCEVLFAVSTAVVLCLHFDNWRILAIPCFCAPFALLKTKDSEALGKKWVASCYASIAVFRRPFAPPSQDDNPSPITWMIRHLVIAISTTLRYTMYYFILLNLAVIIRFLATLFSVLDSPVRTLRTIPPNWYSACFCVDSSKRLELVPDAEPIEHVPALAELFGTDSEGANPLSLRVFLTCLACLPIVSWFGAFFFGLTFIKLQQHGNPTRVFNAMCTFGGAMFLAAVGWLLVATLSVFVASALVRWSVKASALCWAPLVYVVQSSLNQDDTIRDRFSRNLSSAVGRVSRWYSAIMGLFLVCKGILFICQEKLKTFASTNEWFQSLDVLIEHKRVPGWQVAAFINIILVFVLYFYSDEMSYRLRNVTTDSPTIHDSIERWLKFTRGLLSIYTVSCTVYLTATLAFDIRWPAFDFVVFPWSQ